MGKLEKLEQVIPVLDSFWHKSWGIDSICRSADTSSENWNSVAAYFLCLIFQKTQMLLTVCYKQFWLICYSVHPGYILPETDLTLYSFISKNWLLLEHNPHLYFTWWLHPIGPILTSFIYFLKIIIRLTKKRLTILKLRQPKKIILT